jgi:hypothetical protein
MSAKLLRCKKLSAAGACGGSGDSCMTIEMGSLYNDPCDPEHDSPPGLTGPLFKFTLYGANDCNVTISANSTRGGVVLENGEQASTNLPTTCPSPPPPPPCYYGMADYDEWVEVCQPVCWCYPRQCHGDADGLSQGSPITGYYYVGTNDLGVLVAGWNVKDPPKGSGILDIYVNGVPAACADFDHVTQGSGITGYYRVGTNDLGRLVQYWNVKEPPKGSGVPTDCQPGNIEP